MLVFEEKELKPKYPEKTSWRKDEKQQQTQPTYDAESGNRTRAVLSLLFLLIMSLIITTHLSLFMSFLISVGVAFLSPTSFQKSVKKHSTDTMYPLHL